MQYLVINLTEEVKDVYTENYKTLMREIEDTSKWKISCVHGLKNVILSKMLPKQSKVNVIPIKILIAFFHRNINRKIFKKFLWNHKRPWIAKSILRKNKAGCITLWDLKQHYKTIITETVWYWNKKIDT